MDTKPSKVVGRRKVKYQQYQIRLAPDVLAKVREAADQQTRRLGFPVSVSALMRKYITDGVTPKVVAK
jgi:hypothetical protein